MSEGGSVVRVALAGPMGAGKSTVGKLLAERLRVDFLDLDARIGDAREWFARGGEAAFRAREREALSVAVQGRGVLALGGGTVVDPGNVAALRAAGWRVFVLSAPAEELRARVGDDPARPLLTQLESLIEARATAYASAGELVHTSGLGPRDVCSRIEARLAGGSVLRVGGPAPYEVRVEPTLASLGTSLRSVAPEGRCVWVSNPVVEALHGETVERSLRTAGFEPLRLGIPDGEAHKTLDTWRVLVEQLLDRGVERRTPVLAVGGGVTGDLVGFAAASALRGLPLIQVPTTLLAMVDAAVGGKVGVNVPRGKNLVGAFYPPVLVHAGLSALDTLPEEELRCGLGEVLKHAILGGEEALAQLERDAPALRARSPEALARAVRESVALKGALVEEDLHERGRRALLNAGHTLGHALETALGHGTLRHGEAVAIGLLGEARWAARHGHAEQAFVERLTDLVQALGLREAAPPLGRAAVLAALGVDKKRERGSLRMSAPCAPGAVRVFDVPDPDGLVACLVETP